MDGYLIPLIPLNYNKTDEILGRNWWSDQVDAALKATEQKQPLHPATMSPTYGWISHPLISELKQQRLNGERTLILDKMEQDLEKIKEEEKTMAKSNKEEKEKIPKFTQEQKQKMKDNNRDEYNRRFGNK